MLSMSDFDEAYRPNQTQGFNQMKLSCSAPDCFIASYPPVTSAGQTGPFFVNTYFLRPDRRQELTGAVAVTANSYKKKSGC
jgi:hypothetical protein